LAVYQVIVCNSVSIFSMPISRCFVIVTRRKPQSERVFGPLSLTMFCFFPQMDTAYGAMKKIRWPPNAFLIFGQEWRRKVAAQYPGEKTSGISVR
jgi:hypothetical protein